MQDTNHEKLPKKFYKAVVSKQYICNLIQY